MIFVDNITQFSTALPISYHKFKKYIIIINFQTGWQNKGFYFLPLYFVLQFLKFFLRNLLVCVKFNTKSCVTTRDASEVSTHCFQLGQRCLCTYHRCLLVQTRLDVAAVAFR
jgi:hypothetical protein